MTSVVHTMAPFRHEFYAIALKVEGGGKAISGHHTSFPEGSTIFFNSPFQILSWDIVPDWTGFYIMFDQDFVAKSRHFQHLLEDFPFLKIDKSIPFEVGKQDVPVLLKIFEYINVEYHSQRSDRFRFIESYVLVLLNHINRYFNEQLSYSKASNELRSADLKLLTRFQTLIETSFYDTSNHQKGTHLHSPSFYAEMLCVHPNYLNAIVKNITGHTAQRHIHNYLLQLAKSQLTQTSESVKEIAYSLYFDSPNNFNAFFKKHTGVTPRNYRLDQNL